MFPFLLLINKSGNTEKINSTIQSIQNKITSLNTNKLNRLLTIGEEAQETAQIQENSSSSTPIETQTEDSQQAEAEPQQAEAEPQTEVSQQNTSISEPVEVGPAELLTELSNQQTGGKLKNKIKKKRAKFGYKRFRRSQL